MTVLGALVPALLTAAAVLVVGAPPPARLRLGDLAGERAGHRPAAIDARTRTPRLPLRPRVLDSRAGVDGTPPPGAPLLGALLLGVLVSGVLVFGHAGGVLLGGLGLGARRLVASRRRRLSVAGERERAIEACGALAAELRAGRAPAEAFDVAAGLGQGPFAQALRAAAAAARLGGDVPAAMLGPELAVTGVPHVLRALAACWQVCSAAGAGLAGAVDRMADGLRAAQAQQRLVESELAGPRATAGLLAVLPLAGVALGAALGAQPLTVLLHTPLGVACLTVGLALDALGLWWTSRIVARAAGRVW